MSQQQEGNLHFRLPIRTLRGFVRPIMAAKNLSQTTKSRSGFRKRLEVLLTAKGGETRLWRDLGALIDFALAFHDVPCVVEAIASAKPE